LKNERPRILIAGIGGASLGTEILKCLRLAGGYEVFGCDVSAYAFGHYGQGFESTSVVRRESYVDDLIALCERLSIDCVVPGGDEPARLVAEAAVLFREANVRVATNDLSLVASMSDKAECFRILGELGFTIPVTRVIREPEELQTFPMPCIVKPAVGSGGSVFVFFARDIGEASLYCSYLTSNGRTPIVQQYLSESRGEFTVGVLSLPDKRCAGAIALKRMFNSKLSVATKGSGFLISSGYSQGEIAKFPEICATAVDIATRLGSIGPLNIQGRINERGELVPFEINPRFSASTYLRALAGFNEVDHYLRAVLAHEAPQPLAIRPGLYLRSLTEVAVPAGSLKT
jgi:carbamoyl-phosphate synthase large subunit